MDEYDLETETSFFEAQNAERQMVASKDDLFKDQLETEQAKAKAEKMAQMAKEAFKKTQAERLAIEKKRVALSKERRAHEKSLKKNSQKLAQLNSEIVKDRKSLAQLTAEVRQLKAKNQAYLAQIQKAKEAKARIKSYAVKGEVYKAQHQRNLARRKKVLNQRLAEKAAADLGRRPASLRASSSDMNVTLRPKVKN